MLERHVRNVRARRESLNAAGGGDGVGGGGNLIGNGVVGNAAGRVAVPQ